VLAFGMESGGRWALIRRAPVNDTAHEGKAAALEHVARALLRRYGVVFWRLLAREGGWLPPWRELLRVYRRLEARGEIRGGRFVAGFSGEQYALPDAVALLRETRRRKAAEEWVSLSGADPLNLIGVLTPGAKLAALTGNRVLYQDGLPIAALAGGKVEFLTILDRKVQWEAEKRLVRSSARGLLADLA
jgi:ATP-dependent Lhr-like helicase